MTDIAKVKRNVSKMVSMNAPETDIDAYISGEGVSVDDVRNFKEGSMPSGHAPVHSQQAEDKNYPKGGNSGVNVKTHNDNGILSQLGRQAGLTARYIAEGVPTIPYMVGDAANALLDKGLETVGSDFRFGSLSKAVSKGLTDIGLPQPKTPSERVVGDISRNVAGLSGTKALGDMLMKGASPVAQQVGDVLTKNMGAQAASAITGTGAAGVSREMGASPMTQALIGVTAGTFGPSLAQSAYRAAKPSIDPQTRELAKLAAQYNIPVKATEMTDGRLGKWADRAINKLPFMGDDAFQAKRQTAFNTAIAKTIGESADNLSPDVMQRASDRIGNQFETALAGHRVQVDRQFIDDLANLMDDAKGEISLDYQAIVQKNIDKITKDMGAGDIVDGKKLASIRSSIMKAVKRTNNEASPFLREIASMLDDSIKGGLPQDKIELLNTARGQYKNLKTIENLAAKAPDGNISSQLLLGQAMKSNPKMAYGKGGEIADLARIGQKFMKGNSNHSEQQMQTLATGGVGAAAYTEPTTVIPAMLAARGLVEANRNQSLAKLLMNGLPNTPAPPQGGNLLADLLGASYAIPRFQPQPAQ